MRWLALAAFAFLVPGCLDPMVDAVREANGKCPPSQMMSVSADSGLLLPADTPDTVSGLFATAARVHVTALQGQQLVAQATWVAQMGEARPVFEAPPGGQTMSTPSSWMWYGAVPAGEYVLELEGDPVAERVVYTLQISASGCPTDQAP